MPKLPDKSASPALARLAKFKKIEENYKDDDTVVVPSSTAANYTMGASELDDRRAVIARQGKDKLIASALATPEGREALVLLLRKREAKRRFSTFCREAWHTVEPATELQWSWMHELVCNVLQAVFEDWKRAKHSKATAPYFNAVKNLIFSLCPGSLKSRICSVFFPAWCWTHVPGMKFICLSVNEDAAMRDARAMRTVIKSEWYTEWFPHIWYLRGDQDAISNYANSIGGERLSRASGSEIVGLRADCLILDDPNNPLNATIQGERDKVNNLWMTNQSSRINDVQRSLRIIVQQRVHMEDLTGFVTSRDGYWTPEQTFGWLNVVVPAELEKDRRFSMPDALKAALLHAHPELALDTWITEDLRTEEGQSADPVRMPRKWLLQEQKRTEGTSFYATQMQQRPTSAKGDMVQRTWFSFFRLDPGIRPLIDDMAGGRPRPNGCHNGTAELIQGRHNAPGEYQFDQILFLVDCAAKETTKGSKWGLVMMGAKGSRRYILDNRTQRGSILTIIDVARDMIKLWRPDVLLLEDKAAGPDLKIRLQSAFSSGDIPPVQIIDVKVPTGKTSRLLAAIPVIANGLVSLREGATWLEEVVDEVCGFPNYATDDIVDCVTMGINYLVTTEEEGGYVLPE